MNYFFALELASEARRTVSDLLIEWRNRIAATRWYEPPDYHITLKFLGNLNPERREALIETATSIAEETRPFLVQPAPSGGFPNMKAPAVL